MKVLENSTGNSCAIDHQVGACRISAAVTLTSQLGFHCNSVTLTFETLMCKESPCMWQLLCKKATNDRKLREKKTQSGICVWINKIDRQIKLHGCFFCWVFSFFFSFKPSNYLESWSWVRSPIEKMISILAFILCFENNGHPFLHTN